MYFQTFLNRLTPNDPYVGRTAPLTSKRCILYIYSTNIVTEHFKHALYSPFFFSWKCSLFHNANLFGSCIIHILCTGVLKFKKKVIPAPKVNLIKCKYRSWELVTNCFQLERLGGNKILEIILIHTNLY